MNTKLLSDETGDLGGGSYDGQGARVVGNGESFGHWRVYKGKVHFLQKNHKYLQADFKFADSNGCVLNAVDTWGIVGTQLDPGGSAFKKGEELTLSFYVRDDLDSNRCSAHGYAYTAQIAEQVEHTKNPDQPVNGSIFRGTSGSSWQPVSWTFTVVQNTSTLYLSFKGDNQRGGCGPMIARVRVERKSVENIFIKVYGDAPKAEPSKPVPAWTFVVTQGGRVLANAEVKVELVDTGDGVKWVQDWGKYVTHTDQDGRFKIDEGAIIAGSKGPLTVRVVVDGTEQRFEVLLGTGKVAGEIMWGTPPAPTDPNKAWPAGTIKVVLDDKKSPVEGASVTLTKLGSVILKDLADSVALPGKTDASGLLTVVTDTIFAPHDGSTDLKVRADAVWANGKGRATADLSLSLKSSQHQGTIEWAKGVKTTTTKGKKWAGLAVVVKDGQGRGIPSATVKLVDMSDNGHAELIGAAANHLFEGKTEGDGRLMLGWLDSRLEADSVGKETLIFTATWKDGLATATSSLDVTVEKDVASKTVHLDPDPPSMNASLDKEFTIWLTDAAGLRIDGDIKATIPHDKNHVGAKFRDTYFEDSSTRIVTMAKDSKTGELQGTVNIFAHAEGQFTLILESTGAESQTRLVNVQKDGSNGGLAIATVPPGSLRLSAGSEAHPPVIIIVTDNTQPVTTGVHVKLPPSVPADGPYMLDQGDKVRSMLLHTKGGSVTLEHLLAGVRAGTYELSFETEKVLDRTATQTLQLVVVSANKLTPNSSTPLQINVGTTINAGDYFVTAYDANDKAMGGVPIAMLIVNQGSTGAEFTTNELSANTITSAVTGLTYGQAAIPAIRVGDVAGSFSVQAWVTDNASVRAAFHVDVLQSQLPDHVSVFPTTQAKETYSLEDRTNNALPDLPKFKVIDVNKRPTPGAKVTLTIAPPAGRTDIYFCNEVGAMLGGTGNNGTSFSTQADNNGIVTVPHVRVTKKGQFFIDATVLDTTLTARLTVTVTD